MWKYETSVKILKLKRNQIKKKKQQILIGDLFSFVKEQTK